MTSYLEEGERSIIINELPLFCREKLIIPDDLVSWSQQLKREGKTVVTLNGSFDLMHAGHLYILQEAAKQGNCLLVALNSDASIKRYKGASRPIIPLRYRLEFMSALACVTAITWFEEDDPRELLMKIKPDVHVNGSEYGEQCIEAEVVKKGGGRIHIVERIPGLSTSEIIDKISRLGAALE